MYRLLSGLHAHLTRKEEFNVIILGLDQAGKTNFLEKVKTIYNPSHPGLKPSQIAPTIGQNIGRITLSSTYLKFWDLGGSSEIRSIWEKYYNDADAICWVIDSKDRIRNGWFSGDSHTNSSTAGTDPKGKGKASAKDQNEPVRSCPGEGWIELEKVLRHPSISHSNIPVLVICNKQDRSPGFGISSESRSAREENSQGGGSDGTSTIWIEDEENSQGPMTVEEIKAMFNRLVMESERSEKARSLGLSEAHVLGTSSLSGQGIQDAINWLFYRVASRGQSRKTKQQYQQVNNPNNSSTEANRPTTSNNLAATRLADLGSKSTHLQAPSISRSSSY